MTILTAAERQEGIDRFLHHIANDWIIRGIERAESDEEAMAFCAHQHALGGCSMSFGWMQGYSGSVRRGLHLLDREWKVIEIIPWRQIIGPIRHPKAGQQLGLFAA